MLESIKQLLRPSEARQSAARVPAGQRVYAVGDVHGRLDLLKAMADALEVDDNARGKADTTVVLLGDLIDRGPESAGVVTFAREWCGRRKIRPLIGNHEEMFLRSFLDTRVLRSFLTYGGRETILSYPIDSHAFTIADLEEAQALMAAAVPAADIAFIKSFENYLVIGDYLFVHAGIRPGVTLDEQTAQDMRWIREPFLSDANPHDYLVVHGHTISNAPEIAANRIGIDTGAYMSGRLTALGLEDDRAWLIEATAEDDGRVTIATRTI